MRRRINNYDVLGNINKNRNLYDACRRYKHFYKQYKEIEKLEKAYWSKYIQKAYRESEHELKQATLDIVKALFGKPFVNIHETIEMDYIGSVRDMKMETHDPRVVLLFDLLQDPICEYNRRRR